MSGHSTDRASVEGDQQLFHKILEYLYDDTNTTTRMTLEEKQAKIATRLEQAYTHAHLGHQTSVARHEAELVLDLLQQGLLDTLQEPHDYAKCFFHDPSGGNPGRKDPTNVSPFVNCGGSYGHELLFSHTLSATNDAWKQTNYTVAKVAVGGTEIYKDWYPGHGQYWDFLNETIHSTPGEWHGFAWHQGENDCFTWRGLLKDGMGEDTSYTYSGNLTNFMAAVRLEISNANPGRFAEPTDVPVAIFELGFWPQGAQRDRIVEAQNAFVEADTNSVMIHTDDLARFYHFDPVALLIMGNRLANVWSTILENPQHNQTSTIGDETATMLPQYRVRQDAFSGK